MTRSTHEFLMTSAEIVETFHDREALDLETRQTEISVEFASWAIRSPWYYRTRPD